eukprot:TRINITY_DN1065_c0_g1_i1.p1 TRINITY_DN1065_c0_g1~~TRINITY_DN1065_c0_g1_i1.p1  ORF type:complete len:386 (+),score=97.72 TRINITY_DN1065_c0_g1_i1:298-1455(+)
MTIDAGTKIAPSEGDTVALIQQETPQELAHRRYQHATKAEKQRARCCRFFCVFGVFFGALFLLAVPLNWWQTLVCSPPPSVFEGSVLGIELRGESQMFVNLWPENERIFYGRAQDVISVEYEQRYRGVAAYDEMRNLLFWAISKCTDCKSPSHSAHGIFVYSRDGVRSKQVIDIGDMQIQSLAVDSYHPRTGSWRLYAILTDGKVMAYDEPSGWFTFEEVKDVTPMWNFAFANNKLRVLYFGALNSKTGKPVLYQFNLDGKKKAITYNLDDNIERSKVMYDSNQNAFMWLEPEGAETLSIRSFQPGGDAAKFQQYDYVPSELIDALKNEHKVAYDPLGSRFYVLDPYTLKITVIEFENQSVVSVQSYRTRCASPLYLHYVPPTQV